MGKGVGVYIGYSEIVAVSVEKKSSGTKVKNFVIEPIQAEGMPESDGGKSSKIKKVSIVSSAIKRALEKIKEPGAYVNAALSPSQSVTRHFIMPTVPKKDEAGAVFFEASRYIPFKLSESILDYYAQLTHKNVFSVMVTAVRHEILQACLEDLRGASANVLMIEPVYCAVGRALRAFNMIGKTKTYGFIVLQQDGNVNITLTANGIVYLSRDFILSGNIDEDKSRFYEEVKASIDYFYKMTGGEAVGQIFLTGSGNLTTWVEHLESSFGYKIRFDVAHFPNEKNISQEKQNVILIAYGLALWSLKYPSPLGNIKLLPKDERKSSLSSFLSFLFLECLAIFLIFLFVRFVAFETYFFQLKGQNNSILEPLRREDPQMISLPLAELQSEKSKLDSRAKQLSNFLASKTLYSSFFSALGHGVPKAISVDYITFENGEGKTHGKKGKPKKRMNLKGLCFLQSAEKEVATINAWIKKVSEQKVMAEYFTEIKIEEIAREKYKDKDLTKFQILAE
ncbi:MAG TPA: pilus assembly protein PilM [Candidatus Omnitrophota bacterium]|nr:pilus assembly protein PilM [Candidatus Omnitrophota bacterium]